MPGALDARDCPLCLANLRGLPVSPNETPGSRVCRAAARRLHPGQASRTRLRTGWNLVQSIRRIRKIRLPVSCVCTLGVEELGTDTFWFLPRGLVHDHRGVAAAG